jgi:phosphoribosylamine--glycine ligase
MGTIAPLPRVTQDLLDQIKETIVVPCIDGLKKRNRPFIGILYPGIMITADGPKVIEFNARFGDPETQVYMPLLKTDIIDIMLACVNQTLSTTQIGWSTKYACCVILASGGYPGKYEKGKIISGLGNSHDPTIQIFHAGTTIQNEQIVTDGGRVLGITATGNDLPESLKNAYEP